jgi:excisionase family DNA binding protein
MAGHYLRVGEAAELLGVSPATIRWYAWRGWLPTWRVGRGRLSHRRIRYPDLVRLAEQTGRFIPEEPKWDPTVPISLEMAAQYLGLSARFLVDGGFLRPGAVLTWDELKALERRIFQPEENPGVLPPSDTAVPLRKEESMMMHDCAMGPHGGMGPGRGMGMGFGGPRGRGVRRHGWPNPPPEPPEGASLLALRRAKRHLEAQRADLDDQIAELERRIRAHPDYRPDEA